MKPAEVAFRLEEWKQEIKGLHGDDLLLKKLEFDADPSVPDLTVLKSNVLEATLIQEFGMDWPQAMEKYKKRASGNT